MGFVWEMFVRTQVGLICGKYLGNMLEIFVGAQNNLWTCMSILVSGLMNLGLENLYIDKRFLLFGILIFMVQNCL